MTAADVAKRIEEIRFDAADDERAHGKEDALREDVLRAIAEGAPDAMELARLALTTSDIEFARWCA